jgi:hypothetical protein
LNLNRILRQVDLAISLAAQVVQKVDTGDEAEESVVVHHDCNEVFLEILSKEDLPPNTTWQFSHFNLTVINRRIYDPDQAVLPALANWGRPVPDQAEGPRMGAYTPLKIADGDNQQHCGPGDHAHESLGQRKNQPGFQVHTSAFAIPSAKIRNSPPSSSA